MIVERGGGVVSDSNIHNDDIVVCVNSECLDSAHVTIYIKNYVKSCISPAGCNPASVICRRWSLVRKFKTRNSLFRRLPAAFCFRWARMLLKGASSRSASPTKYILVRRLISAEYLISGNRTIYPTFRSNVPAHILVFHEVSNTSCAVIIKLV